MKSTKSFTLIELMIVIALMGALTGLIVGNFVTSLKKGRDAKRKGDLQSIRNALESYYEDKKSYPSDIVFGDKLCETTLCNASEKVYMYKVPADPSSSFNYVYQTDVASYFKLYSCIENNQDQGEGVLQSGYGATCGACGACKFGIASTNMTP